MVEPQYRPNLVQALSRSPFHAGSGIDKATYKSMQQQRSTNASPTGNGAHYSKVCVCSTICDCLEWRIWDFVTKNPSLFLFLAGQLSSAD